MSVSYPSTKAAPVSMGFKDPDAVLDYAFLWQDWLELTEVIVSHVITASSGLTVNSHEVNTSLVTLDSVGQKIGSVVTVWLSGGTSDTKYTVSCRVTTSFGRTDERSFQLTVKER